MFRVMSDDPARREDSKRDILAAIVRRPSPRSECGISALLAIMR